MQALCGDSQSFGVENPSLCNFEFTPYYIIAGSAIALDGNTLNIDQVTLVNINHDIHTGTSVRSIHLRTNIGKGKSVFRVKICESQNVFTKNLTIDKFFVLNGEETAQCRFVLDQVTCKRDGTHSITWPFVNSESDIEPVTFLLDLWITDLNLEKSLIVIERANSCNILGKHLLFHQSGFGDPGEPVFLLGLNYIFKVITVKIFVADKFDFLDIIFFAFNYHIVQFCMLLVRVTDLCRNRGIVISFCFVHLLNCSFTIIDLF